MPQSEKPVNIARKAAFAGAKKAFFLGTGFAILCYIAIMPAWPWTVGMGVGVFVLILNLDVSREYTTRGVLGSRIGYLPPKKQEVYYRTYEEIAARSFKSGLIFSTLFALATSFICWFWVLVARFIM